MTYICISHYIEYILLKSIVSVKVDQQDESLRIRNGKEKLCLQWIVKLRNVEE